ncbi:hypothetical protein J1N35_011047 [Gossypium stocksii]|uniref:Uncharacterized protein n=1 Tax=Gossypium stocksii TaxID=47602 RepID=A0A9D4ACY0_9ROSI|nr:hypothetical protein J1N35_011047 [Gossypium stocksii]
MENSLPSNSPKSNDELVWSRLLCSRSRNSNALSVDRLTLCMWAEGEYALNRRSSSFSSSEPSSTSSGLVGTGSGLENDATSAPSGPGSQGGSTSDSLSNPPSSATYEVPLPVDVIGSTSSLFVDVS